jgi:hypothetical protein
MPSDNLGLASVETCELERILIRLGATQREEEVIQIA